MGRKPTQYLTALVALAVLGAAGWVLSEKLSDLQFDQIMDEDMLNMAPMQESMESAVFTGIPLNYQERRIWHLHEQIDRMIGRDNIPEELRVEQLLDPYVER